VMWQWCDGVVMITQAALFAGQMRIHCLTR